MSTYTYITQSQALTQIAARLYDPTMRFWSSAELALYLNEALQTWNALTAYWRGDFVLQTTQGVAWYDLSSAIAVPNTPRPYTITDVDLLTLIEYHLLEPATGAAAWTGSLQFTLADLLGAIARRRDELLSLTSCTQTRSLVPAVAGRIQLADNVIDVRRMAYLPSALFPTQAPSTLWPEDAWAEQSFDPVYTLNPAGTPLTYLMSTQPPIAFDVDRPPAYAGSYELLTVNAGSTLAPSPALASTLSIPDDWTHVIKWGALADLLSRESNAKDLPRAAYCEQRYRLGVAALLVAPALLAIRSGNVPLQIDAVRAADLYNASWQALAPGAPTICLHAGLNLIAIAPTPDASPYSLSTTVIENAPLPSGPSAPVEVARDDLDVILDYTQHLAAFKMGGSAFTGTIPLLQRFLKQAAAYNRKLAELGEYTSMLLDLSQRERDMAPVSTPAAEAEAT